MGVLYAKVGTDWVPITGSAVGPNWPDGYPTYDARYVNVDGDTMTGALVVGGGGAIVCGPPVTGGSLQVGTAGAARLLMDNNDITAIDASSNPTTLGLNNCGGNVNISTGAQAGTVNINTGAGPGVTNIGTGGAGAIYIGQQGGNDAIQLRGSNTSIPDPAWLGFGTTTRQMINLYGGGPNAGYGIGVQSSGFYARSGGGHYWYNGGTHSDTQGSPGSGGIRQMAIDGGRLKVGDWTNGANNLGEPLRVFGPNPGACDIGFWHGAETNARSGYVGFANDTQMALRNERTGAEIIMWNNVSQPLRFGTAGAERMRIDENGHWLVSKTDPTSGGTGGLWWHNGNNYLYYGNNAAIAQPNIILDRFGAGAGSGHDYIHFRNANTTIGSIQRSGTSAAVVYNTTSDYRLKDDRGLITGALDRLGLLRPRRVHWKETPESEVVDGFFAHEVAVAVPEAVTGAKDAIASEEDVENMLAPSVGAIIPQMLDTSMLVPLLVAAVQELAAQVAQLKGAA